MGDIESFRMPDWMLRALLKNENLDLIRIGAEKEVTEECSIRL